MLTTNNYRRHTNNMQQAKHSGCHRKITVVSSEDLLVYDNQH